MSVKKYIRLLNKFVSQFHIKVSYKNGIWYAEYKEDCSWCMYESLQALESDIEHTYKIKIVV